MVAPVSSSPAFEVSTTSAAAGLRPASSFAAGDAKPGSFAATLESALKSVSQAHQAGVEGVGLEQTMVAMQKAQIGFQAALAVRNRLVSAYSDIMNMQV